MHAPAPLSLSLHLSLYLSLFPFLFLSRLLLLLRLVLLLASTLLRRFLHTTRGDLAAAQRLLELNYALRNKHAQIFIDRDPMDASSQQLLQVA